jgi:aminoglycoside phosphotransferase (APT) family kinase protein
MHFTASRAAAYCAEAMNDTPDTGFIAPRDQVAQDWHRLAAYLGSHGHDFAPDPSPRQFAGGFGNLNYLIEMDGGPAVLRRPPPGPLPPGANDMLREGRILRGLEGHFALAPRCLFLCEDIAILGAPFLIMEYRRGIVIGGTLPAPHAGNPQAGRTLTATLCSVLSDLHAVDAGAAGLDRLGRPEGFLARTAQGWAKRAELAWEGTAPAVAGEILDWLDREPVIEGPAVLLHNDFKLDNFILDPASLAPRALIDWDLGTRGDSLWDLAVLLSYWTEPGDPGTMHDLAQMPTTEPGFPTRAGFIERYARLSGRDVGSVRQFRAVAQFRLAVVFRQIFRRYRDSGEANPRAGAFDELAEGLLAVTREVMAGRTD